MRPETNTFLADLAQLTQAKDLKAAGVGKHSPIPTHESVQPAQLAYQLMPRPQIEVIGVSQNDLRIQVFQHVLRHGFYRGSRSHRHEYRRLYNAVRCMNL